MAKYSAQLPSRIKPGYGIVEGIDDPLLGIMNGTTMRIRADRPYFCDVNWRIALSLGSNDDTP